MCEVSRTLFPYWIFGGFAAGFFMVAWVATNVSRRDPDHYFRGVWTELWYQRAHLSFAERWARRLGIPLVLLPVVWFVVAGIGGCLGPR